jgi:hypothetical protein
LSTVGFGAHCTVSVVWNGLAFASGLTPVGSALIVIRAK